MPAAELRLEVNNCEAEAFVSRDDAKMLDERAKVATERAKVLDKRAKVARDHNLHWHALRRPLRYSLQAFLTSKLAAVKRPLAGHETARETARMITRVEARMERPMLDPLAGRGLCLCVAIWKAMTKMAYPSLARRPRPRGGEKRFIRPDLALIHGAVCTELRQLVNMLQPLQASHPRDETALQSSQPHRLLPWRITSKRASPQTKSPARSYKPKERWNRSLRREKGRRRRKIEWNGIRRKNCWAKELLGKRTDG
jgi:hypothetical protein